MLTPVDDRRSTCFPLPSNYRYPRRPYILIIDEEIHKASKEFKSKYAAHVKEIKKQEAESLRVQCMLSSPYRTRSKTISDMASTNIKMEEQFSQLPNDKMMECVCTVQLLRVLRKPWKGLKAESKK